MENKRMTELAKENPWLWQLDKPLLLAVSGGVDSMVLLDIFMKLSQQRKFSFAVAHVNHQLRSASEKEEAFLQQFCQKHQLPFFSRRWPKSAQSKGNLEQAARQFRYTFFKEVVTQANYAGVVVAHHADDLAETFLMKLIKGSQLKNIAGLKRTTKVNGLWIYRPLLSFAKIDIERYAKDYQVEYFEDETNASDEYQRNRLRHHVIPLLKAENANFLNHVHQLVTQIEYSSSIVDGQITELTGQVVTKVGQNCYQIDRQVLLNQPIANQYMLLVQLCQDSLIAQQLLVNEAQIRAMLSLLTSSAPQKQISLANNWRFYTRYQYAYLEQKTTEAPLVVTEQVINLQTGIYLSDTEWLAFSLVDSPVAIPSEISQWESDFLVFASDELTEIHVRKRKAGDRIRYNQAGQQKKLNRLLIDQKIPQEKRMESWVVTDQFGKVLWFIPYRKSYLSIPTETDKIKYRVIYFRQK